MSPFIWVPYAGTQQSFPHHEKPISQSSILSKRSAPSTFMTRFFSVSVNSSFMILFYICPLNTKAFYWPLFNQSWTFKNFLQHVEIAPPWPVFLTSPQMCFLLKSHLLLLAVTRQRPDLLPTWEHIPWPVLSIPITDLILLPPLGNIII